MKRATVIALVLLFAAAGSAWASSYTSPTPLLSGGTLIDFEGKAEGTLIDTQYPGVTFSQLGNGVSGSFRPMIDNDPFLFGYHASSGVGVLTGSTEGAWPFPTVAPMRATFASGQTAVEFFFSDDAPLGTYTIEALDSASSVLDTVVLSESTINLYVGFSEASGNIAAVRVTADKVFNDAYSWDDLRYSGTAVPYPGSLLLLASGLAGLAGAAWRARRSV